jgi:origin recognition complex subunit 2
VVLSSVSHTAREVFRLVADAQLDPGGDRGAPFGALFRRCRDRFLVSNEMLLKSFLQEFKDHDLVATK